MRLIWTILFTYEWFWLEIVESYPKTQF